MISPLRILAEDQLLKASAGLLGSGQYILTEMHTKENRSRVCDKKGGGRSQ